MTPWAQANSLPHPLLHQLHDHPPLSLPGPRHPPPEPPNLSPDPNQCQTPYHQLTTHHLLRATSSHPRNPTLLRAPYPLHAKPSQPTTRRNPTPPQLKHLPTTKPTTFRTASTYTWKASQLNYGVQNSKGLSTTWKPNYKSHSVNPRLLPRSQTTSAATTYTASPTANLLPLSPPVFTNSLLDTTMDPTTAWLCASYHAHLIVPILCIGITYGVIT